MTVATAAGSSKDWVSSPFSHLAPWRRGRAREGRGPAFRGRVEGSDRCVASRGSAAREVVQTLLVALVLALVIRGFVIESFLVDGISMEPTLHDGERLLVDKLTYRWHPPERFDIVVFRYPLDPSRDFVKRVIGLPGETVSIREGRVYVDGRPLEEPYLKEPGVDFYPPTTVPPGHVFVLGDNRPHSDDSRSGWTVPLRDVIGRAWLVYWPPSEAGLVPHP